MGCSINAYLSNLICGRTLAVVNAARQRNFIILPRTRAPTQLPFLLEKKPTTLATTTPRDARQLSAISPFPCTSCACTPSQEDRDSERTPTSSVTSYDINCRSYFDVLGNKKHYKLFRNRTGYQSQRLASRWSAVDQFPDMPCMKRVYTDKKASVHWSAARNEEPPWSYRYTVRQSLLNRAWTTRRDPVYIGLNMFVPFKTLPGPLSTREYQKSDNQSERRRKHPLIRKVCDQPTEPKPSAGSRNNLVNDIAHTIVCTRSNVINEIVVPL